MKKNLFKNLALGTVLLGLAACGSKTKADFGNYEVLGTQGPFLSRGEVHSIVVNAGFDNGWESDTAVDIAYCESSFGTTSYAIGGGRRHTGLFQISDLHINTCGKGNNLAAFRKQMENPQENADCAFNLYSNRGNFDDWDCYTGKR